MFVEQPVRDMADAHIRAIATPAAAGKRFLVLAHGPTITYLQLAQILRDRLGVRSARNWSRSPGCWRAL